MSTATVSVIGLGVMGMPMAGNLIAAGHTVHGLARTDARRAQLESLGGHAVERLDQLPESDVVLTVLPDAPDVRSVLLGGESLQPSLRPGTLVIDHSTIAPHEAREISASLAEDRIRFLDAPVSGGESGAVAGQLSIMVGGAAHDVERALPVLSAVGSVIRHVGPTGSGQIVKAANQMIVAAHLAVTAEALALLTRHDLDVTAALDVLRSGLAGSRVLDTKTSAMLTHTFTPGFRAELHRKDLRIAQAAARSAGSATPVTSQAALLMEALCATGHGHEDHSALLRVVDSLSRPAPSTPTEEHQ